MSECKFHWFYFFFLFLYFLTVFPLFFFFFTSSEICIFLTRKKNLYKVEVVSCLLYTPEKEEVKLETKFKIKKKTLIRHSLIYTCLISFKEDRILSLPKLILQFLLFFLKIFFFLNFPKAICSTLQELLCCTQTNLNILCVDLKISSKK